MSFLCDNMYAPINKTTKREYTILKKQFIKKITAILVSSILTFVLSVPLISTNQISQEEQAYEKFNLLIEHFYSVSSYSQTAAKYPDEYAGAYYKDGTLNICLTNYSDENIAAYSDVIGSSNIAYINAKFSYNYLLELNSHLVGLMQKNLYGINSIDLYQKDNIVEVSVFTQDDYTELLYHLTSEGYASNSFNIVVANRLETPTSTYARPGDRVYRWNATSREYHIGTIAFNARAEDGTLGFVTAEHVLWYHDYVGIYETKCAAVSECIRSKETDSCFVPFSAAISGATGLIQNSGLYGNSNYKITAYCGENIDYLEGSTLTGFGKTSGMYTGTVYSTNHSYTLAGGDDTVITHALRLQCPSGVPANGDSGGCIVRITNSSSNPKTVTLVGLLSSVKDYEEDEDEYRYASVPLIYYILEELNVTVVGGSN